MKNNNRVILISALLAAVSMSATADNSSISGYAQVQDIQKSGVHVSFDETEQNVSQAIHNGQIKPISALYAQIDKDIYGQINHVELDKDDGQWVYNVKLVHNNQLLEAEYDAMTLHSLELKGQNVISVIKLSK